ncbi:MAG: hypothetical protein IPG43_24450 [Proteobacteria bacterium]|nr:hypothetical protein [Pseudomonadota bacterium]
MKSARALITVLLCCTGPAPRAAPTTVEVPLNIPYALVRAACRARVHRA